MKIVGRDVYELFYNVAKELINSPLCSPRDLKTKEIIKAELVVQEPKYCVVSNGARNLSLKYLGGELDWYLSGDKSIDKISEYSSFWEKIADLNREVNSNYGEIIFKQKLENFDNNQYSWVLDKLFEDKYSRKALINFNQPKHKSNTNDFVCATSAHYMIRDNKLISIVDMRSNDLIFGFSYDFPFFSYLHQNLFLDLKEKYADLELCEAYHDANSLHVYERHFNLIEKIVKEYELNNPKSKTLDELGLFKKL